ncbi:hypothetical protein HYALB_00005891 [Hymenoscyphus albidus]|uniref:Zn(2)-C6 fungal-type domain-containing protein n=1 Tax=Hymenoscyphus albidus TaxID=595503 RepID=A0A9N9LN24_9HELO|nr:hypothetical protein HYALB_00005891 [Hymenoscyphus albidus]
MPKPGKSDSRAKRPREGDGAEGDTGREKGGPHSLTMNIPPRASSSLTTLSSRFSKPQQPRPQSSLPISTQTSSGRLDPSPMRTTGSAPPGKVAIPALRTPQYSEASSSTLKKCRTAHACNYCRRTKAGCTGEKPCQRCKNAGVTCTYGDGKREAEKKKLSRLSQQTGALTRYTTEVSDALQQIQLESKEPQMTKEDMRAAIDRVIAMTPSSHATDLEGYQSPLGTSEPVEQVPDEQETDEKGSTGSLDAVHVDTDRDDTRPTGHIGKSSSVSWAKRTAEEVLHSGSQESSIAPQESDINISSYHTEDQDIEQLEFNPLTSFEFSHEWPEPLLAEGLVQSYFKDVHNSLPILDKPTFLGEYRNFRHKSTSTEEGHIWLGTLNLVFAISSYHADLKQSKEQRHYNSHQIYLQRAKLLCMNDNLLYKDARISTVCGLGLLCLYYTATCNLNRAWTIGGLMIRQALILGLHVRNDVDDLPDMEKEYRIRLWWSLYSLECLLNELTGRPSCISDTDISTPLPLNIKDGEMGLGNLYERRKDIVMSGQSSCRGSRSSKGSQRQSTARFPVVAPPLTNSSYFIYRTHLSIISHETITELYCATTTKVKWTEVQNTIKKIHLRLSDWESSLPDVFDFNLNMSLPLDIDDEYTLQRTGLAMIHCSCLMILFRPYLCRFDLRLKHTHDDRSFTQEAVQTCIHSARKIIALVNWSADGAGVYSVPPWWNTIHYICQALAILILEIAFRSQHMPEEAEDILKDAKIGVNWLSEMSRFSISARKAWHIYDKLIRIGAPVINQTVFDMPMNAPIPPGYRLQPRQNVYSALVLPTSQHDAEQANPNPLSQANLQQYQNTQGRAPSPNQTTTAWASESQPYMHFDQGRGLQQPYPSQAMGNPLDHTQALNLFQNISGVHGHYDDLSWAQMFETWNPDPTNPSNQSMTADPGMTAYGSLFSNVSPAAGFAPDPQNFGMQGRMDFQQYGDIGGTTTERSDDTTMQGQTQKGFDYNLGGQHYQY